MSMVIWEASPEAAASHSIVPPHGLTPPPPPGLDCEESERWAEVWVAREGACLSV